MLILEMFRVAAHSIRISFMRSFLTMLGVIIGIAAVITMVALGNGARQAINEQLDNLGGDIISVRAGQMFHRGIASSNNRLTVKNAEAIASDMPSVLAVVPQLQVRKQIKLGNQNRSLLLVGTTPNFAEVNQIDISYGRVFSNGENAQKKRVIVLGGAVPGVFEIEPEALLGQAITIAGTSFEVIGILEEKGSIGFNNRDEFLYVPLQTAQYRIAGTDRIDAINVNIIPGTAVETAMMEIERILRRELKTMPGAKNIFTLSEQKQFLAMQKETAGTFSTLLAGVAIISLIVGGIGIMNIMLVTVTERTREIGIRKALGATRLNILTQFMIEAMCLCIMGGILGIGLGIGASNMLAQLAGWQVLISLDAIALAFVFSAGVGLFFGLWPAQKAAQLDPIEALQYE